MSTGLRSVIHEQHNTLTRASSASSIVVNRQCAGIYETSPTLERQPIHHRQSSQPGQVSRLTSDSLSNTDNTGITTSIMVSTADTTPHDTPVDQHTATTTSATSVIENPVTAENSALGGSAVVHEQPHLGGGNVDDDDDGVEGDSEGEEDDDDDDNSHIDARPSDPLLPRVRALEPDRSRHPSRGPMRFNQAVRERYILGCSMLLATSIAFIVLVSGVTTMLANRNFPKLKIYTAWKNGGIIPLKYGCHAPGGPQNAVSFPLRWRNVPRSATNLVILFAMSQSANSNPVHWLVTDIPLNDPTASEDEDGILLENASTDASLMPHGALQLANSFSRNGSYWPPCTPEGKNGTSLFVIRAYAIDAHASIDSFRDAREVVNRFVGVPFAKLSGKYGIAETQPLATKDRVSQ